MRLRIGSLWAIVAALLASACGGNGGATPGDGTVADGQGGDACSSDKKAMPFSQGMAKTGPNGATVKIYPTPPVPMLGDHDTVFKMEIDGPDGNPVSADTTVTASCLMTHTTSFSHGCAVTPIVKQLDAGMYQAKPVIFNMAGHWTFTVGVGSIDSVTFDLCLQ